MRSKTMINRTRRDFLADVGRGMLLASVGPAVAIDVGLASAGALANARTFGGEDYTGFHAFMALLPSYQMAQELPKDRQALPILKVLYRNTSRIQDFGGKGKEVLHPVHEAEL